MTTLATARDALADVIRAGVGLRCLPYMTDDIPAPCGHLRRLPFDPRMVMGRASATYGFNLKIYLPRVAEVATQKQIDEYSEATGGICSAVEDESLWPDDLVQSAYVINVGEAEIETVADETFMTTSFEIEVIF